MSAARIIPAGAGKSALGVGGACGAWDHPRGCGEKVRVSGVGLGVAGSSPRVRGKADAPLLRRLARGIIPAGAGKRVPLAGSVGNIMDHPRGCGEK